jgi:hypothetical protein
MTIGNNPTPRPLDGKIDEFRIANYAYTQAEIQTACATQIGTPPPTAPSGLTVGSVGVSVGDKGVSIGF